MLIVEDGSGIVGAESYNTVDEANAYNLSMGYDDWPQPPSPTIEDPDPDDPNLAKKEAMLRRAAIYLDASYGYKVNGTKKNPQQGLIFPVVGGTYWNGYPIDPNSVPPVYKNAQMEVARYAYNGVALAPTVAAGEKDLIRKKIDVLEWEWEKGTNTSDAVFGWLDLVLASLFGPPVDDNDWQVGRIVRA